MVLVIEGVDALDFRSDIIGVGLVGKYVRVLDMDDDPTHQDGIVGIPLQGGPQVDREANSTREGRCVDIPPAGGRYGRGNTT